MHIYSNLNFCSNVYMGPFSFSYAKLLFRTDLMGYIFNLTLFITVVPQYKTIKCLSFNLKQVDNFLPNDSFQYSLISSAPVHFKHICKMCVKTICVPTNVCSHAENSPVAQTFIEQRLQRNHHFAACVTPFKSFREK